MPDIDPNTPLPTRTPHGHPTDRDEAARPSLQCTGRADAETPGPDWIAADFSLADWAGTDSDPVPNGPRLRVWAMGADSRVIARRTAAFGDAAQVLAELTADWRATRTVPIIACGLNAWNTAAPERAAAESASLAPRLRPVPCPPLGAELPHGLHTADARGTVYPVPGLSQLRPSPDMLSGAETRIAGVLAAAPDWDGVICLTGTRSVWAEVSAREVISFRSFMTAEMDSLLATRSSLRPALDGPIDETAFDAGLAEGLSRPETLAARLPGLLAETRLNGMAPGTARGRLAGLLSGAELAAAKPWWLGREIIVVGDGPRADRQLRALAAQGAPARRVAAEEATLAGLALARTRIGAA